MKWLIHNFNSLVINISGSLFGDFSTHFRNLKSITFEHEGVYGSVTTNTFEGVEKIEMLRFIDTSVTSVEKGSFDNLKNIKGMFNVTKSN